MRHYIMWWKDGSFSGICSILNGARGGASAKYRIVFTVEEL